MKSLYINVAGYDQYMAYCLRFAQTQTFVTYGQADLY